MAQTQISGPAAQQTACGSIPGGTPVGDSQDDSSYSRFAVFVDCPQCGGDLAPEHAHFRCGSCGWRDSCCD